MNARSSSKRNHVALFSEIDALCAEIDEAALDAEVDRAQSIQETQLAQDARDRQKRLHRYTKILEGRIVAVHIEPFESPRDRASMTINGSFGEIHENAEISECFGLLEYLLSKDFSVIATGKYIVPEKAHEGAQSATWFVLQRGDAQHCAPRDAPQAALP